MSAARLRSVLGIACAACLVALALLIGPPAWAAPVDWHEVPASAEGRQWWDAGSLRLSREGRLTVLSRFTPPAPEASAEASRGQRVASQLYVMELDCDQELYRDISVNGLPRFRAEWQAAAGDALSTETLRAACRAGAELLGASTRGREARDG
ncbi:MAG: hypothetical protein VKO44_10565 [Cyanobacteriota bacterium]|nr:hypothetical protein [Cyanobacteriota bacterium]